MSFGFGERRWLVKTSGWIIGVVMATVVFTTLGVGIGAAATTIASPTITVNAVATTGSAGSNGQPTITSPLAGVSVLITSVDPTYAVGGEATALPGSSGIYELFSGYTNANGVVRGQLNSVFETLVQEWIHLVPSTATVSLTIDATYEAQVGNSTAVYMFYNSIPYNPRAVEASIATTAQFDLAAPAYVEHSLSQAPTYDPSPQCIRGGVCCPSPTTGTQIMNTTYVTGPFPVAMEYDNAASNPDFMNLGLFSIQQSEQFSFSGASFTQGGSFSTFGTNPSYSESGTQVQDSGGIVAATSSSSTAVGVLYINGVTLFVENSRQWWITWTLGSGGTCVEHESYGAITTQVQISSIQTVGNAIDISSQTLGASWGQYIMDVMNLGPSGSSISLPAGQSFNYLTGMFQASGYSNMNNVEHNLVNFASDFTAALGLGLAVIEAASLFPFDSGTPVIVGEALSIVSAAAGIATTILSGISSISWSETLSTSLQQLTVTNDQVGAGAGMHITFYQSVYQTELQAGSDPTAWMPSPFVVGTN